MRRAIQHVLQAVLPAIALLAPIQALGDSASQPGAALCRAEPAPAHGPKAGSAGGNRICRFAMNTNDALCESSDALFLQGAQDPETWAVVDVLVWPTRAWIAAHGGWDPALARLQAATSHANRIYAQSDTRIQLRFELLRDAAWEPARLEELNDMQVLNLLHGRGGDMMLILASGHESLNEMGCRANNCGLALRQNPPDFDNMLAFANRGRAIVFDVPGGYRSVDSAGQTIFASIATFGTLIAHELGHLMGLGHDVAAGQPATGRFPYSHGFLARANNSNIGDAMSGFPPASFFSNPRLQCPNGVPCGNAETADAARSLKETRFELAAISPTTWRSRGLGTGMWFNPRESGQGWSFTQQGETIFAAWFTHGANGDPLWLVGPALRLRPDEGFHGAIYVARQGLPLDQASGRPALRDGDLVQVGNAVLSFNSPDWAQISLDLELEGKPFRIAQGLSKIRLTAGALACGVSHEAPLDLAGLWNQATEPGWGLFLANEQDRLFAVVMTYNPAFAPVWRVASLITRQQDGSYTGELYRTRGVPYDSVGGPMFRPLDASTNSAADVHGALVAAPERVGDVLIAYEGAADARMTYRADGIQVQKPVARYVFSSPAAGCRQ